MDTKSKPLVSKAMIAKLREKQKALSKVRDELRDFQEEIGESADAAEEACEYLEQCIEKLSELH